MAACCCLCGSHADRAAAGQLAAVNRQVRGQCTALTGLMASHFTLRLHAGYLLQSGAVQCTCVSRCWALGIGIRHWALGTGHPAHVTAVTAGPRPHPRTTASVVQRGRLAGAVLVAHQPALAGLQHHAAELPGLGRLPNNWLAGLYWGGGEVWAHWNELL